MRSSKFGASIRRLVDKAVTSQRSRHECPKCHKIKLRRRGNALWVCSSCDATIAGGAFTPKTEAGEISVRLINDYSKQNA